MNTVDNVKAKALDKLKEINSSREKVIRKRNNI